MVRLAVKTRDGTMVRLSLETEDETEENGSDIQEPSPYTLSTLYNKYISTVHSTISYY